MRTPILAVLAAALLVAADLPGQRRGRFNRGGGDGPPAAPAPDAAAPATESKKPKAHLAILGGDVYLGTGQRLTGATVLCGDDKILAVGHNLQLPEGTKTIDAKGKCVSPGFVAVMAAGMGAGRSAPFVDSVNPFDPEIVQGLAAGVTAFLAGSAGSSPMPSGDTAVIKLARGDVAGMVLQEGTVLGMSSTLALADLDKFKALVKQAKEHKQALADFVQKKAADPNAKPPQAPAGTEKILDLLDDKARLWVQLGGGGFNPFGGATGRRRGASNQDLTAIQDAMAIAQELGKGVVLVKPVSAWLCPQDIAATGSMAIISPRDRAVPDPADRDHTGSNLATSAILAAAGVPVAVTCPIGFFGGAGVGTHGLLGGDLNTPQVDAGYAIRGGLDDRKGLRTITLDAAKILGVDKRIGSLEVGKDADILILDGDPLHYKTFVETAIVNGKVVYEKHKEAIYSHIPR